MSGPVTGFDILWRVKWCEKDTTEHTEVLPLIAATQLIGSLMGRGVQVIAIWDEAVKQELDLDAAEVVSLSKSPYRFTQD